MWKELKELLQRTEKMTETINTSGVLNIISEIEKSNMEDEYLPF